MKRLTAAAVLLALAAVPAWAGICITQGDALSCTDAGMTFILKAGEGVSYARLAGQPMTIARDGQGTVIGMIGERKLVVQKLDGLTIARFGDRKLVCTEAGPGITLCK